MTTRPANYQPEQGDADHSQGRLVICNTAASPIRVAANTSRIHTHSAKRSSSPIVNRASFRRCSGLFVCSAGSGPCGEGACPVPRSRAPRQANREQCDRERRQRRGAARPSRRSRKWRNTCGAVEGYPQPQHQPAWPAAFGGSRRTPGQYIDLTESAKFGADRLQPVAARATMARPTTPHPRAGAGTSRGWAMRRGRSARSSTRSVAPRLALHRDAGSRHRNQANGPNRRPPLVEDRVNGSVRARWVCEQHTTEAIADAFVQPSSSAHLIDR